MHHARIGRLFKFEDSANRSAVGPDHRDTCGDRLPCGAEARWQTARLSAAFSTVGDEHVDR